MSRVLTKQSQPNSHTLRTMPQLCQSTAPRYNAQQTQHPNLPIADYPTAAEEDKIDSDEAQGKVPRSAIKGCAL